MKDGILWVFAFIIGAAAALAEPPPATQGAFAVELATKLGLGAPPLEEDAAIQALGRAGIRPDAGWYREGPATELFVVQIQKSVHLLLDRVSRRLKIPVPPTLNLQVLSTEPFSGQTIYFDPEAFEEIAPPPGTPDAPDNRESSDAPGSEKP